MALTVQEVLERLVKRSDALQAERRRIVQSSATELSRVEAQIAALDRVVQTLQDRTKSPIVDSLFDAVARAGLKLELKDV